VDLRLGRRVCEVFGWRSLSSGSRGRKEEGRGGGEGAGACGGRAGGRALRRLV